MTNERAIEALLYEYAERLDRGDFAGVGALFRDGTFGGRDNPRRHGAAAVQAALETLVRRHDDGTPRTKHVTTNVRIAVDATAGTASASSYFTVLQQTATLPLQTIAAGRYSDRFVCADGTWRFAERVIDMDLVGDLREHLLPRRP